MKNWLLILAGLLLVACGDDEDETANRNLGWVDIREPIIGNGTFATKVPSVEISGNAFVSPADVDCVSVRPVQLTLTWRNDSTGQSGRGRIGSFCQNTFLGLQWASNWSIPEDAIDLQFGDNVINITATDNAGNRGTATINIIREDDVTPPAIVGRSPASGSVDVPIYRTLSVRFSEAMLRSSLASDRFKVVDQDGFEVVGFRSYDEFNHRWQFEPQVDFRYLTTYTVTISGLVEDAFGGNVMGSDVSWTFTTARSPDVTSPSVSDVSPAPGSACAAPDANIYARFDESLDSFTVNEATFILAEAGGDPVDATVRYDGMTAVLDPLLPLIAGTEYEATLAAEITDLGRNPLGADFRWTFWTTRAALPGTWTAASTSGEPFERFYHSAVWTGSEIIVWGGYGWHSSAGAFGDAHTGGRYNPITDSWSAMSTDGAPPLSRHSAVFTGTEMLVWGGDIDYGARYEPGTDTWQPMSRTDAPSARHWHAAVWTGSEMIVWGGANFNGRSLGDGARYDPATDTWTPMSMEGAPSPRSRAAAIWTGTDLIVWGGTEDNIGSGGLSVHDGARYNPGTDTWTALPASDAPAGDSNSVVWTGSEMIVWDGGQYSFVGSDGFPRYGATLRVYDPATQSWRASSASCEPFLAYDDFHSHWTGTKMFVWAGDDHGGFLYDPVLDTWEAVESVSGPAWRSDAASVWTGEHFFIWGGRTPFDQFGDGYLFAL
jgi:hypothetical protein